MEVSKEDLDGFKEELRQTRAQLAVDPDNEELKVLEQNYIELIELAEEDQASAAGGGAADAAGSAVGGTASASWAVGGKCQAPFQGVSYVAVIDAIDGAAVTVTFDGYGNTETVDVSTLQPPGSALPAGATAASHAAAPAAAAVTAAGGGSETAAGASKKRSHDETAAVGKDGKTKEEREAEREKKKKKREKRKEKDEEKDKAASKTANSWQKFNSGSRKGKAKKSIFRSTDNGKVGIGTNGMGGKGMTEFAKRDKWNYDIKN